MKATELKNLAVLARLEAKGYFKNSMDFAQKQYDKHIAEVTETANKVYNAYLPQGEEVAMERKLIYIERNAKNISEFI
jgi:hypothetical protein